MVSRTIENLSVVLFLIAGAASCKPDIEDHTFLIDGPRVLAIAAEPAEAKPGATVALGALYVDTSGTLQSGPIDWALCRDRKPLTEPGVISSTCLVPSPPAADPPLPSPLVPLGVGVTVMGTLFEDGCRTFGPDPPPPKDGETPGRPVDPDFTGGFYLPLRLREEHATGDAYTSGRVRLVCELSGASQAQFIDFNQHYRANGNPTIATLTSKSVPVSEDAGPSAETFAARASEAVPLHVEWPACPTSPACGDGICGIDEDTDSCADDCTTPKTCGGSETYLWFDRTSRQLSPRREAIRVSWFATAGSFQDVHTGRDEASADQPTSDNVWIAPASTGDVVLWVVLRDDRGGAAWKSYRLRVGL